MYGISYIYIKKVVLLPCQSSIINRKDMNNIENIKGQMRDMEAGQTLQFPIERLAVVRVYASDLSAELNRDYKTRTDRPRRIIEVIRRA